MRKLASIQRIWDILPIENADNLELAKVMGWQCVVKKNEFQKMDLCVYFEVDSFLPIEERYEFLRKSSYRSDEINGEGFRIKTAKLRGCLSQGICLPLSMFPEIVDYELGQDVTSILKVKKWEVQEMASGAGTVIGNKPYGIPTTDEIRVQSDDSLRTALLNKPYYISTKMDGTSCTVYLIDGHFGVCGRNYEYSDDGNSSMYEYMKKHDIENKLKEVIVKYDLNSIVIQGEFCGPGVQKNPLNLNMPKWYIFNVFNGDNMRLIPLNDELSLCKDLGEEHVPIEETGDRFNYSLAELLQKAKGKYLSGKNKEGIVVRSLNREYSETLNKELSFKVINNDYLLKEEG